MAIKLVKTLSPDHKTRLRALWNREYPKQLSFETIADLDDYLNELQDAEHYFLFVDGREIAGWLFLFTRDRNRWFGLIVDTAVQGKGYGSQMMHHAMARHEELHGWVVDHNDYKKGNGLPYPPPIGFYNRLGFKTLPESRIANERMNAVHIVWKKTSIHE